MPLKRKPGANWPVGVPGLCCPSPRAPSDPSCPLLHMLFGDFLHFNVSLAITHVGRTWGKAWLSSVFQQPCLSYFRGESRAAPSPVGMDVCSLWDMLVPQAGWPPATPLVPSSPSPGLVPSCSCTVDPSLLLSPAIQALCACCSDHPKSRDVAFDFGAYNSCGCLGFWPLPASPAHPGSPQHQPHSTRHPACVTAFL